MLIGKPAEKKANPENVVDGQFSGPFVISAALATGAMGWDSYQLLHDARVRSLLARITCEQDPEIEAEFPANMSGKITIAARGQQFVALGLGDDLARRQHRRVRAGLLHVVRPAPPVEGDRVVQCPECVVLGLREPGGGHRGHDSARGPRRNGARLYCDVLGTAERDLRRRLVPRHPHTHHLPDVV